MVCDSTNALVEGHSGSEAEVRRNLAAIIRPLKGRVAVTCFATNIARVESIARAAEGAGRQVSLFGRSLRNAEAAARECGYLKNLAPFVPEEEAGFLPDDSLLIICTGSQGEPRSALAKIAADTHPNIALGEGDTVIFSSRMIPGNERGILRVQDSLARRGCRVMTADDHMVHVSGHPARDELKRLYELVKPRYAVPVHGEWRHLAEHAALAEELGAKPMLVEDGDVLRLAPGRPDVVEGVPTGRFAVDGGRLLPLSGAVLNARKRMLFNGVVMASLAVDAAGRVHGRGAGLGARPVRDGGYRAGADRRRPHPGGGGPAERAPPGGRRAPRGGAGGAPQGRRPPAAQAPGGRGPPAARVTGGGGSGAGDPP